MTPATVRLANQPLQQLHRPSETELQAADAAALALQTQRELEVGQAAWIARMTSRIDAVLAVRIK